MAYQVFFSGLVLLSTIFIPDTPRWLAKYGRLDEARHVIARLLDRADTDEEVDGQLTEILNATILTGRFSPHQNPFPFSGLSKTRQEGEC